MSSPKTLARLAGLLYLAMALCSGFAEFYVRRSIVVPGDAVATAENIRASAALVRLGVVTDLVQAACFLLTAMALYALLKQVDQSAAAMMVTFVAVSAGIQSLNLLTQVAALAIAIGESYQRAFGPAGSDALVMLFIDLQHDGFVVAQLFFGLRLLRLGYLVARSGYFPRMLAALLVAACAGYLADLFVHFLAPASEAGLLPVVGIVGAVGELGFMAWLLVVGVRVPTPATRVPAPAPAVRPAS